MIRINRRFRGPASSGNGGYTAGVLASLLPEASAVQVTLRRPPPLDTDLRVPDSEAGQRYLLVGDELVAEALIVDEDSLAAPVEPVDLATARTAEESYAGRVNHPFPECFVCGPERHAGDGLVLAPGRLRDGRTACTWTPDATLAGVNGAVAAAYVWAALDCPGGWAGDLQGRPMVLGRMAARIGSVPDVGSPCIVVGQRMGTAGRKTETASTVYDSHGRLLGRATHTWVHVDPADFS